VSDDDRGPEFHGLPKEPMTDDAAARVFGVVTETLATSVEALMIVAFPPLGPPLIVGIHNDKGAVHAMGKEVIELLTQFATIARQHPQGDGPPEPSMS
jgi:hypothetical protein